jgi:hypothetical protein
MAIEMSSIRRFGIRRPSIKRLAWSPVLVLLFACAGKAPVAESVDEIPCLDPRPQVCTMEYDPVCATLEDGSEATYSNACGACADAGVRSYRPGTCG